MKYPSNILIMSKVQLLLRGDNTFTGMATAPGEDNFFYLLEKTGKMLKYDKTTDQTCQILSVHI